MLHLVIATIAGGAAGTALVVAVRALMLMNSRASSCDRGGDSPFPSGACLNGIGPILSLALLVALLAGVLAVVLLIVLRGWVRRVVVVVAFVAGVFAGQPLFAGLRGTELPVAWTASGDPTLRLTTAGAWTAGGSLIRVQTDQVLSYEGATGHVQWTLPLPGGSVPCAVSDTSASAVGLVGYTRTSPYGLETGLYGACDHVMAIDLRAGRQLWSMRAPSNRGFTEEGAEYSHTGTLAVAGQTAVLSTGSGVMGLDARSGARRWKRLAAPGCAYQQVAASARALVAVTNCSSGIGVIAMDPATGRQSWQVFPAGKSNPSCPVAISILSASPVVIASPGKCAGGSLRVRVLGPGGVVTATFSADLRNQWVLHGDGGFPRPVTVAGGLLVGLTSLAGSTTSDSSAVAAYRLSDGHLQWRDAVPAGVADIGFAGGETVIIDESGPDYLLRGINLGTGRMRPLGRIPPDDLNVGDSGLYAVVGRYVIVNREGARSVTAFAVP